MGGAYKNATDERGHDARQCIDPFHLIKLANEAIDKTRRWSWNQHRRIGLTRARWVKRTRWALVKDPDALDEDQWDIIRELKRRDSILYRCWQLKEALRDLYRLRHPNQAPEHRRRRCVRSIALVGNDNACECRSRRCSCEWIQSSSFLGQVGEHRGVRVGCVQSRSC